MTGAPLTAIIHDNIRTNGPLTIAAYMELCLTHPQHGYYHTRDPLGEDGDFTTAPEISQLFGEMLAIWLIQTWEQLGKPEPLHLVELGPGRGTLMRDIIRTATSHLPTCEVHFVECNPVLQRAQQQAVTEFNLPTHWHNNMNTLPHAPCLFIANEFFDALPIHQYIRTNNGWRERLIDLKGEQLAYTTSPQETPACAYIPPHRASDDINTIYEYSPESVATLQTIAHHIKHHHGAALIIDYGYNGDATIDTLQAVKSHQYTDILMHHGTADLTAHVNFSSLLNAAKAEEIQAFGPVTQGDLLGQLGIGLRTKLLSQQHPTEAQKLLASTLRLTDNDAMGTLFKAIALMPPHAQAPYGF